ncbi:MAG: hypothetical protein RLZZ324_575 [Candidatus Parcubacteria bacterium]|jgi:HAD superfamily hydrolase (TIGR01509 family)
MPIKAILSDIGEVVAPFDNSRTFSAFAAIARVSVNRAMHEFVVRGLPKLKQYERGDISTEEYQKTMCSRLNLSKPEMPTAEEFHRAYSDVFTVRHDVLGEWKRLRASGLVMVAVSNICEMRHRWLHEEHRLFDVFDHLVMSYLEGHRKPSAELMTRALDRAGVQAEEALFVDDLAENLLPAAALGIVTHHFTGPEGLFKKLAELGL